MPRKTAYRLCVEFPSEPGDPYGTENKIVAAAKGEYVSSGFLVPKRLRDMTFEFSTELAARAAKSRVSQLKIPGLETEILKAEPYHFPVKRRPKEPVERVEPIDVTRASIRKRYAKKLLTTHYFGTRKSHKTFYKPGSDLDMRVSEAGYVWASYVPKLVPLVSATTVDPKPKKLIRMKPKK